MNYIKELKAFKDWLLLNELSTSAIALWHTLMAINNMTGWKSTFNAPNPLVQQLTALSKQGLVEARKKLLDNGLIAYKKGQKNKAPVYQMISLVNSVDSSAYQTVYPSDDPLAYQMDDQGLTVPKPKPNETKQEGTSGRTRSRTITFFVQNFNNRSSYVQSKIAGWESHLSPDIVIAAMKIALEKNARSFNYCEAILKEWLGQGLQTLDDVRSYEAEKKQKRKARHTGLNQNKSVPRAYQSLQDWANEEGNDA